MLPGLIWIDMNWGTKTHSSFTPPLSPCCRPCCTKLKPKKRTSLWCTRCTLESLQTRTSAKQKRPSWSITLPSLISYSQVHSKLILHYPVSLKAGQLTNAASHSQAAFLTRWPVSQSASRLSTQPVSGALQTLCLPAGQPNQYASQPFSESVFQAAS